MKKNIKIYDGENDKVGFDVTDEYGNKVALTIDKPEAMKIAKRILKVLYPGVTITTLK